MQPICLSIDSKWKRNEWVIRIPEDLVRRTGRRSPSQPHQPSFLPWTSVQCPGFTLPRNLFKVFPFWSSLEQGFLQMRHEGRGWLLSLHLSLWAGSESPRKSAPWAMCMGQQAAFLYTSLHLTNTAFFLPLEAERSQKPHVHATHWGARREDVQRAWGLLDFPPHGSSSSVLLWAMNQDVSPQPRRQRVCFNFWIFVNLKVRKAPQCI